MRRGSLRRRLARVVVGCAVAAVLLIVSTTVAAADCGDTSAAVVQGQWQYIATVSFTNSPAQHFGQYAGVHPAEAVAFFSTCLGGTNCFMTVGSATSPSQPLEGTDQSLYSDGSTTLAQSGSDYSAVVPSGGFGGPNLPPCRPPSLAYHLTVHVAAAVKDGSGTWHATYLTGNEQSVAWWTCNGSVGVASSEERVDFVAVPAGSAFPASVAALCTPAVAHPVVAASPASTPQNPQQSTISTALTPPASAFQSLGHAVGNALITLGIVLFITFPATLFNKTFEENYDDIRDIAKRRFGWLGRLSRRVAAGDSARATRRSSAPWCWSAPPWAASTIPTSGSTGPRCSRTARSSSRCSSGSVSARWSATCTGGRGAWERLRGSTPFPPGWWSQRRACWCRGSPSSSRGTSTGSSAVWPSRPPSSAARTAASSPSARR